MCLHAFFLLSLSKKNSTFHISFRLSPVGNMLTTKLNKQIHNKSSKRLVSRDVSDAKEKNQKKTEEVMKAGRVGGGG